MKIGFSTCKNLSISYITWFLETVLTNNASLFTKSVTTSQTINGLIERFMTGKVGGGMEFIYYSTMGALID